MEEKRKSKRLKKEVTVAWKLGSPNDEELDSDVYASGKCINISIDGICLQVTSKTSISPHIKLLLKLPDEKYEIIIFGKVLWYESADKPHTYNLGITFITHLPIEWREHLIKYEKLISSDI